MLPIERQSRIKQLIQEKKHLKISALSKELGVSEMTVHRDLKPLLEEGIIIKTFGGITLSQQPMKKNVPQSACVLCSRPVNDRLSYRLILEDNAIESACCAHCGLIRHRQLGDTVIQAICRDFLMHTTIGAEIAWYVIDSALHIQCCQPQVLTFENKQHAEMFVKGFGGKVLTFTDATQFLTTSSCCHKH